MPLALITVAFLGCATFLQPIIAKSNPNRQEISVFIESNGELRIESGLSPQGDVTSYFDDGMNTTGWGVLEVKINPNTSADDTALMYAAGYAEGYLTSKQIYQTYQNTINASGLWNFVDGPTPELVTFMDEQKSYMASMIEKNTDDPFWQYANLLNEQIAGLQAGYNASAAKYGVPTYNSSWPFEFLNLVGDLLDLMSALSWVHCLFFCYPCTCSFFWICFCYPCATRLVTISNSSK